eukprot:GHVP01017290.1.p1 GENE.GHVP01017290.1~~GHVP01017290.1.p1  ORF type:complete len:308 (-),score=17.06 GHVP01017290.1:514-1437(-)
MADNGRIARWWTFFQQYDLKVVHMKGRLNKVADWLSRVDHDDDDLIDEMGCPFVGFAAGLADQEIRLPTLDELKVRDEELTFVERRDTRKDDDGTLRCIRTGKLFVPVACRAALLYWFHCGISGGHCGARTTARKMKRYVWWPNLQKDAEKFVVSCMTCAKRRVGPSARNWTGVLAKPRLFEMISLDNVHVQWQHTDHSVLVIIDHCTRYMHATSYLGHPTGKEMVVRLKEWVSFFGAPTAILVDRGPEFVESSFRSLVTETLGSRLIFTSPGYPQGNSINESSHNMLRHALDARRGVDADKPLSEL